MNETRAALAIGDGSGWSFLNGPWRQGEDGALVPPTTGTGAYLAVVDGVAYGDFAASCRFRFHTSHGGVRLVFRLQDATRYYALDIPWCGQQNRNRHLWAGLVLADGTPLQRYMRFGLVPEIVPRHHHWYEMRLDCRGRRLRAWLEGRLVVDLDDGTYADGQLGLMAITAAGSGAAADFMDLEVRGAPLPAGPRTALMAPGPHWIEPCPETDPETCQSYPNIIRSRSGQLTASVPFGNPNLGEVRRTVWVRSDDAGRTWSAPEPAALEPGLGAPFVRQDGTWVAVHVQPEAPTAATAFHTYQSRDEGRTWEGPQPLQVNGTWPAELSLPAFPAGQILRLRDGALLLPVSCLREMGEYVNARFSTDYVLRSDDDGRSWSVPAWCDANNAAEPSKWFSAGNFSEIGLAEVAAGVVIGYGRPGPWPYMWRVQSNDGGRTWEPAAYGAFPGYCSTLTRTASGALVAVHRFPYLGANLSRDGGVTWDAGTILDYPIWANHQALEVEPDVILVNYMGYIGIPGQADRRVLRLRVGEHGLQVAP